jgi:hypothetical protein
LREEKALQAINQAHWSTRPYSTPSHTRPNVEQDLCAYFATRCDIEPPSNFSRMVAAIGCRAEQSAKSDSWHVVTSTGSAGMRAREQAVELDERLLKLLDEQRPVRRCLGAAGERAAELLELGCAGSTLGLEAFGQRAALAPMTRAARGAWIASSTSRNFGEWLVRLSWRNRKCAGAQLGADRLLVAEISAEALALWREAFAGYSRALARWQELQRLCEIEARAQCAAEGRQWGAFDERRAP